MGKKRKDKQILTLIRQCQELALTATTEQTAKAENVIELLKKQYPKPQEVKRDLGKVVISIFSDYGDLVGAVVVDKYIIPLIKGRFSRRI